MFALQHLSILQMSLYLIYQLGTYMELFHRYASLRTYNTIATIILNDVSNRMERLFFEPNIIGREDTKFPFDAHIRKHLMSFLFPYALSGYSFISFNIFYFNETSFQ